ncbi:MAG: DNA gyrase subunit B [Erysipelotrichaceae bacterium]|jgi:topoisomerase-4 subunit B|nr:DNA gyrase subunit B [Erysipelotrichaceae bacterium]
MANNKYDGSDIQILEGMEAVRLRPAMYIGSASSSGLHHLVKEIVANSIDEALAGFGKKITVILHKDDSVSVIDEGRGIPVSLNKEKNISTARAVFEYLHAGGKFKEDGAYQVSGGMHGVGVTVTNALSEYLTVTICRDGKIYTLQYEKGGKLKQDLLVTGTTNKTGTTVRFKADILVFKSGIEFKYDVLAAYLQENAYLLKGVKFILINEKNKNSEEVFYYENGLKDYIAELTQSQTKKIGQIAYFEDNKGEIKSEIALQFCDELYSDGDNDKYLISFANNIRTKNGGTHVSGFKAGLTQAINDFAFANNLLKGKERLEGIDIYEGLVAIISVKIPTGSKMELQGQTKDSLNTPEVQPIVKAFIYEQFKYYLSENKKFSLELIEKCYASKKAREAARKAREDSKKIRASIKQDIILSDKLTPAQSKDFEKNELFIVEGDSAGGTAKKGRDRLHQAILPLRGKPLNVESANDAKILQNEEIQTMINTIGAGIKKGFNVKNCKYGKIIIMTDADDDGAHIQTLLLTFFYRYMPQLIDLGMVYVAYPPLYRVSKEVSKKMQQIYAWNDEELDAAKKRIGAGYRVSRYKGLGEMDAIQLKETTMDPKTRTLIQVAIENDMAVNKSIRTLMAGSDTSAERKQWVLSNIDFTLKDSFVKETAND